MLSYYSLTKLKCVHPLSPSLTTLNIFHYKSGYSDPYLSGPVRVSCSNRVSSEVKQRAVSCVFALSAECQPCLKVELRDLPEEI